MTNDGGRRLQLLIADGDAAFVDATADAVRGVAQGADIEMVPTGDAAIRRATDGEALDGVLVGDTLAEPIHVIEQLDTRTDLSVVYLTDRIADESAVADAIEAGVDDYFPRTASSAQYELVTEVIANAVRTDTPTNDNSGPSRTTKPSNRASDGNEPFDRASRAVFEHVSDGLVLHDVATGEILDANQQFCELNGYDRAELVGEDIGVVTPPSEEYSYQAAREKIEAAREEGIQLFEWRNQRKNGETFPVEVHLSVVPFGDEECVLASVRDITERKRREREYEQIFNGVNDGIAIQDPETADVVDVNQTYVERLGYESTEGVLEQGYEGLAATDAVYTKAQARELCHRVMETGEPETVEWQLETKSGDRLWIEATVSPAVIAGEDRIISIQRDITEQRQLERRLRTITERIDEIVYLTNGDLSEALYVNSAYADVFGRPVDELYEDPETYFESVVPEDRETFESGVAAMRADTDAGDPDAKYEFEYRIRRPDGEVRRVETTSYPVLDETSGSHRYVNVTEDVTGRRAREQRLSVLNRVLRHNVRNGLDVVLAHTDRIDDDGLRSDIRDPAMGLLELSVKAREAEEVIAAATDTPDTIALTDVAERVVDRFQASAHPGEITLEYPSELRVPAHRMVIRRVLAELVENALTHSDKDTPRVDIRVRRPADAGVEIAIADNGPGIPEQERQILTTGIETQLQHGQGIGLWFVNWAVTQSGGELYYRPNTPEGSIVTIRL